MRQILQPPVKSRFQTLIQDLKETTYDSYWNKEVGKSRDPTAGLPAGMDPKTHTFGSIPVKGIYYSIFI